MRRFDLCAGLFLCVLADPLAAAPAPEVIASIKPIHSLAAGVMDGIGAPGLLVKGAASPHSYAMRPSDAARLEDADVVFWIGPAMETFLARPLAALAADAEVLEIETIPGLVLHAPREGGVWAPPAQGDEAGHEHGHGEDGHGEEAHAHGHEAVSVDPHLWLDPGNAAVIAAVMAETLAAVDPANAAAYRANARALVQRIDALDAEIATELAPVRDRPFVVFHDAYQYFEAHYGLAAAGAITVSPEQPPGARRLSEIRAAVAERDAACVFREPQFEPALVELVIEGTAIRQGELDPEGAGLAEGPDLYFELMRNLARSFSTCLAEGG